MAVTQDLIDTIKNVVNSVVVPQILQGTVQSVPVWASSLPAQVLVDGASQGMPCLIDSSYIPSAGDRVYIVKLGSDWVIAGKVIPYSGAGRLPSLDGGYAEAYLSADAARPSSGNFQMNLTVDPGSDPGWLVSAGSPTFLQKPPGLTGKWVMSVGLRWYTGTTSSATSYRHIMGVGYRAAQTDYTAITVARSNSHATAGMQCLAATSPEFDIGDYDFFQLMGESSTASDTYWSAQLLGLSIVTRGLHGTYMSLRRVS